MASEYYGVNIGQHLTDVVKGSSTNSTNVEVRADLSAFATAFPDVAQGRAALLQSLEYIVDYIMQGNWPPA